jgi:hypothetical protein
MATPRLETNKPNEANPMTDLQYLYPKNKPDLLMLRTQAEQSGHWDQILPAEPYCAFERIEICLAPEGEVFAAWNRTKEPDLSSFKWFSSKKGPNDTRR